MPDQPTVTDDDPSDERLKKALIQTISGFRPAVTGTLCDLCNAVLTEGDTVHVSAFLYRDETGGRDGPAWKWALSRTHCAEHEYEAGEMDTNAVVRCELGPPVSDGEAAPLYNPEVVGFHRARATERAELDGEGRP